MVNENDVLVEYVNVAETLCKLQILVHVDNGSRTAVWPGVG